MTQITEDDILKAVRAALTATPAGQQGMTTRELATALGLGADAVLRILRPLVATGEFVSVKVIRSSIDGRQMPTIGWRSTATAKPKTKTKRR